MNDRWTQSTQQSIWLLLVMALLMADQGTKFAFSASLGVGEVVPVTSWLNFVHVHNSGGPFSVLSDAGGWQRWLFSGISATVAGVIALVCLTCRMHLGDALAGALIVSGCLGNTLDRLRTGSVVEFLDVHWDRFHWPSFNLADLFMVCAILAWWWVSVRARSRHVAYSVERDCS